MRTIKTGLEFKYVATGCRLVGDLQAESDGTMHITGVHSMWDSVLCLPQCEIDADFVRKGNFFVSDGPVSLTNASESLRSFIAKWYPELLPLFEQEAKS